MNRIKIHANVLSNSSDSKAHGANMKPIWVLSAPDGPHVGPMNLAIRVCSQPFAIYTICWDSICRYVDMWLTKSERKHILTWTINAYKVNITRKHISVQKWLVLGKNSQQASTSCKIDKHCGSRCASRDCFIIISGLLAQRACIVEPWWFLCC